jgi:hypothetical protein
MREYLVELERENPVEAPVAQQEKVSTTDPDSTYAAKSGPSRLGYYDNYLIDNVSCVIVGVQATPARLSQESAAARDMIERYRERYGYLPQTLAADTTYGNGELLQWLENNEARVNWQDVQAVLTPGEAAALGMLATLSVRRSGR